MNETLLCFAGVLSTQHTETDRVPMPAGREVPGDKAQQKQMPVLSLQEMSRCGDVT